MGLFGSNFSFKILTNSRWPLPETTSSSTNFIIFRKSSQIFSLSITFFIASSHLNFNAEKKSPLDFISLSHKIIFEFSSICLSKNLQNKAGNILFLERFPVPPTIMNSLGTMLDLSDIMIQLLFTLK